jgi:hypothetical protein
MSTTALERENLEAHVDLCAERYKQLEYRLEVIETKVEQISKDILVGQKSMSKVIIGSTGTIVAALLSTIATVLITF